MGKIEGGLYDALQKVLKKELVDAASQDREPTPKTCVELYDIKEVRELAESSNRVSDYLGGLWRKGLVLRLPAAKDGAHSARWAYQWKEQKNRPAAEVVPIEYTSGKKVSLLNKPSIQITDDGREIVIDMPALSITIKIK